MLITVNLFTRLSLKLTWLLRRKFLFLGSNFLSDAAFSRRQCNSLTAPWEISLLKEELKKLGWQHLYLAPFHSLWMMVLSSGTDSTALMTVVSTFPRTFLPSPGRCVWKLFKFMVLCLTVQYFLRQTERPIKHTKGPLFVLQICIRYFSFTTEMSLKEYKSLEFSGISFCCTCKRMWQTVSLPTKHSCLFSP